VEEGVEVWDAANGEQVASFRVGDDEEERAYAVAVSQLGGRPVVVAGTDSGKLVVFDLSGDQDDDPIHEPSTGHEGCINAVDVAMVDDRAIAVTGGADGTVRIWDLANSRQIGPPLTGHHGSVEAVVVTTMQDRPVALTAGRDGVVHIWDLTL
jgi:WD40 repeat protein